MPRASRRWTTWTSSRTAAAAAAAASLGSLEAILAKDRWEPRECSRRSGAPGILNHTVQWECSNANAEPQWECSNANAEPQVDEEEQQGNQHFHRSTRIAAIGSWNPKNKKKFCCVNGLEPKWHPDAGGVLVKARRRLHSRCYFTFGCTPHILAWPFRTVHVFQC